MQSIDRRPGYCASFLEISKGRKISLAVLALLAGTTLLHAAPSGGTVTSGSANIAQSGSTTTVTQTTLKASINWNRFSVGTSETVNFVQPSIASITLNRVIGNEKSVIDGALNANGQVWILNSNGVLFCKNASISTSGLLATTQTLSDADFQAGEYSFKGDSSASVINLGTIEINNGGYAVLLADSVDNEGTIKAIKGDVTLTGAREATINLNGNSLVSLKVDKGVLDALVENKGAIYADGGEIYLTANAVNDLLKGVVNQTGILEADSIDDLTGEIILYAHGGTTNVGGTLSAIGGTIETSGENLHVSQDVGIKAKEWVLDPTDITVQDGGGTNISGSTMDADTITTVLNGGTNVTLSATGDIHVNEDLVWSGATYLRLTAGDEIYVNAAITNTNTTYGGVYFSAANTTSKVIFGTDGLVTIYNPYQLQWSSRAVNGKYALGGNINASVTSTWNSGAGFVPIGTNVSPFTGTFDGNGYTIDGLSAHWSGYYFIGLIGYAGSGATIHDVGLTNASIIGSYYVGGLVGYSNHADIHDAYAQGSVSGLSSVGGLVGYNNYGTIDRTYAEGSVLGTGNSIGGLVGKNLGSISDSYATGSVAGQDYVGGLVGYSNYGTLSNVYASGDVSGSNGYTGGLVGILFDNATVTNAYATGNVSGLSSVGGLIGENDGTVSYAYAMGHVSGTSYVGGLVGWNSRTITASYWDSDTSGQSNGVGSGDSSGVSAVTSSTAFNASTYSGWDFSTKWYVIEGYTRPFLRSEYSTTISNDHQLQLMALDLTTSYTLANSISYTGTMWSSAGFVPIGNDSTAFTGTLDGDGYTIDALTINRSGTNYVGLFGYTGTGGVIENISLTDATISGTSQVGGLVGYNLGTISDAYVTGSVSGTGTNAGGLVGWNGGSITDVYASSSVNGYYYVGGLVGYNQGTIGNAYATGSVIGTYYPGGLVGMNSSGSITASFWNTETSGQSSGVGGGDSSGVTGKTAAELQLFSTFESAGWDIGVGTSTTPSLSMGGTYTWTITAESVSYTLSDLSYTYQGSAYSLSALWSSLSLLGSNHSASWVYGTDYLFLDVNGNTITSYTDAGTYSNLSIAILRNGYTLASSGNTLGTLTITPASLTIRANNASKTYDGTAYSGGAGVTYNGFVAGEDAGVLSGSLTYSGDSQGAIDAGTYTISVSGLSSGNYTLSFVDGVLSINTLASTTPSVANIENGTATRSPFFASNTTRDTLTQTTQTEALQEIIAQASSDTTKVPLWTHSLIQLVGGGVHLPEGLEQEYFTAQR